MELVERLRSEAEADEGLFLTRSAKLKREAADLLEEALKALEDLESANDAVSGRTSHARYHTDLTEDLHESLDWLDGARSFARFILTKSRGEKIDG